MSPSERSAKCSSTRHTYICSANSSLGGSVPLRVLTDAPGCASMPLVVERLVGPLEDVRDPARAALGQDDLQVREAVERPARSASRPPAIIEFRP